MSDVWIQQITLPKREGGGYKVTFTTDSRDPDRKDNQTVETIHDDPAPPFFKALERIRAYIPLMTSLGDYKSETVRITGVKLKYAGEDHIVGASFAVSCELHDAPNVWTLDTPFRWAEPITDAMRPEVCMKPEWAEALENFLDEVVRFAFNAPGGRAQMSLVADEEREAA